MIVKLLKEREILITNKFNKLINIFNEKFKLEKSKKICLQEHLYGYAPFIKSGCCRICWGELRKSKYDIFKEIISI